MRARAIVLDIEGTTTSIRFVYDTLFPFVREHVASYIERAWTDPEVQADVEALRAQAREDLESGLEGTPQIPKDADTVTIRGATLANIRWQMDEDRKTTGLKSLQGKIWRDGYGSGELQGHVYEDVVPALKAWKSEGIPVYIYSSGSVAAQKLLFGHSVFGDLCPLLSGYFDTTTGPKKVASSYIAVSVDEMMFLTDNLDEAIAAREAGVHACISIRPGNPPLADHDFMTIRSFDAL